MNDEPQASFTLRRNGNKSVSWSITIPCDGEDYHDVISDAIAQALELNTEIEEQTRRPPVTKGPQA